jgi:hypothetical protein
VLPAVSLPDPAEGVLEAMGAARLEHTVVMQKCTLVAYSHERLLAADLQDAGL